MKKEQCLNKHLTANLIQHTILLRMNPIRRKYEIALNTAISACYSEHFQHNIHFALLISKQCFPCLFVLFTVKKTLLFQKKQTNNTLESLT